MNWKIIIAAMLLSVIGVSVCCISNGDPKQSLIAFSVELSNVEGDLDDVLTLLSEPDDHETIEALTDFKKLVVATGDALDLYIKSDGSNSQEVAAMIDAALAAADPLLDLVIEDDPDKARDIRIAVVVVRAVLRRIMNSYFAEEAVSLDEAVGLLGHGLSGRVAA